MNMTLSDRTAAATAIHTARLQFVKDALYSVPWERRQPTRLTMPCGCIWSLVERADSGGKWADEEWQSCPACATVLGESVPSLVREGWGLILGWALALCIVAPLGLVALLYGIRWFIGA